jgi:hypothetical protein
MMQERSLYIPQADNRMKVSALHFTVFKNKYLLEIVGALY